MPDRRVASRAYRLRLRSPRARFPLCGRFYQAQHAAWLVTEAFVRGGLAQDGEMVPRESPLVATVAVRAPDGRRPSLFQEERVTDAVSASWRNGPGGRRVSCSASVQGCRGDRAKSR